MRRYPTSMTRAPQEPQVASCENVLDARRCRPEAFTPVPLGEGVHLKALLVCFEPGQRIPVHAPAIDLAILVLEGEGTLTADGEEIPLKPGAMAFVPAGQSRGITATTHMTACQVVSPPPTDADHRDVTAGLTRKTNR